MGLVVATKAFFKLLFDRKLSESFERLANGQPSDRLRGPEQPLVKPPVSIPQRGDAISLLAALQREARLIDLIQESLDDYNDQQVGAAAREVIDESRKVLQRMFQIVPMVEQPEGDEIATPAEFDPAHYRLTGNVSGQPPFRGKLAHHGWKATRCDVPAWTGSEESKLIVAPIELDLD